MATRVQIPYSFNYSTGGNVIPAASVPVSVYFRNSDGSQGAPATVWQTQAGVSQYNSLQTDAAGNVLGWVAEGTYKIVAAASGSFTGGVINFDALYGGGTAQIAANSIGTSQMQSGIVLPSHLASDVLQALIPTGVTVSYSGTILPAGFLWCDGTGYSTSTYATLFGAIGYVHGGSGSTFHVPDKRGRAAVGAGQGSGLSTRALASTGGEENHTLAYGEMTSHNHSASVSDPGHAHSVYDPGHSHGGSTTNTAPNGSWSAIFTNSGFTNIWQQGTYQWGAKANNNSWTPSDGTHGHGVGGSGTGIGIYGSGTGVTVSLGTAGSGNSHNNMQPWIAVNHIIKY